MSLPTKLILAAADLSSNQPIFWANFMNGLSEHMDKSIYAMLTAPPEALPTAQGQCRVLSDLINELSKARQTAESLRK